MQSWRGSAEIRGCHIEFGPNAVLEHIFVPYRAGHFVLEDCVVEFPEWTHMTLYPTETPPQTVYEFANNTILGHSSGTDTNDREFSVYLVNNILWDYNCGLSPQARPEVLEFRFNCFMYAELQPDCGYQIGNFVADPLFCGPAAGDYRLQPGSPCIGAGEGGENVGARLGICWPTDVEEVSGAVAHRFSCKLSPNPTTGGVAISLDWVASASDHLHIEIFDVTGKLVRVLGSPDWESKTCAYWDGRLADGRAAPAGVYHVGVHRAGGGTTRRLIMLR